MVVFVKKIASFLVATQLLCNVAFAQGPKDIKYLRLEDDTYQNFEKVIIASKKETNEIIPFSLAQYDNYLYAYVPNGEEIEVRSEDGVDFWDADEWNFGLREFSARGILKGYEDGSVRPYNMITRAEMATIFAKLFDMDISDDTPYFEDTNSNDWYTKFVTALYKQDVIEKGDKFNPSGLATREEVVNLTYNILNKNGFLKEAPDFNFSKYIDIQDVSEYAIKAYKCLYKNGYRAMEDYGNQDFEQEEDEIKYLLVPQKTVTREECITFLYSIIREVINKNAPAIRMDTAPDAKIPVIDGSTSTYSITQNIYREYYYNSDNCEDMPKAHSKTTNAYKRLIDNEVEMIFVPDATSEILEYAKQKDVKLRFIPIASEALVFFTDKDNNIDSMTTKDLYEIYVNNSIKNWSEVGGENKNLVAFCRNKDSGSHAQMEKFILDGGNINDEIYKEKISLAMSSILTDVTGYNENNNDSIAMGYSLYYYYNTVQTVLGELNLKLISIDGIKPSDETIRTGEYPYTTNYYAVVRDEENETVDKFLELLKGDFGKDVIVRSGLGVLE